MFQKVKKYISYCLFVQENYYRNIIGKKQLKMKYLTNLRSDQGVFPFRLADVDVVVVASTQTNRKFYNIKLSRYINA